MFKKLADWFSSFSGKPEVAADAVRSKIKTPPPVPVVDDDEVVASQVKPAKRLSDVSQMRLAAYVERTGNTE